MSLHPGLDDEDCKIIGNRPYEGKVPNGYKESDYRVEVVRCPDGKIKTVVRGKYEKPGGGYRH